MPNLTPITYYHCETAENWSFGVISSDTDKTYIVRWDSHSHLNTKKYTHDYSCTCKAYIFGGGKYCKHIHAVIKNKDHCNWMQMLDGGKPIDGKCPRCGKEARPLIHGV
jgi:hypothetical protein